MEIVSQNNDQLEEEDEDSDKLSQTSNSCISPNQGKKREKHKAIATKEMWSVYVLAALDFLRKHVKTQIDIGAFTVEGPQNRYTVKDSYLHFFKIFPWFHATDCRYRQTLKAHFSLGSTIDMIIEAVNYFLWKQSEGCTNEELEFLFQYYQRMIIPIASHCLTTIVEVYNEFRTFQLHLSQEEFSAGPRVVYPGEKRVLQELSYPSFTESYSNTLLRNHPDLETYQLHKRSRNQIMPDDDWKKAITAALDHLQSNVFPEITIDVFTYESKQNRFLIRDTFRKVFKIFPWLQDDNIRYRQSLKKSPSEGITIDMVIEAVNYFITKCGREYTEDEIQFLYNHYEKMDIPKPSQCLTTIVEVYQAFKEFADLNSTVYEHCQRIQSLNTRVTSLENAKENQPSENIKRRGGDRACWFKICDADLPSRHEWCVPGGVFGLYSDGVGRLLPSHIRPFRSVVVYSTDPDTVEACPNPEQEDDYARVVMVGEAPVILRADQYVKLKQFPDIIWDIYVNKLGDVCLRKPARDSSVDGTIFATTYSTEGHQDAQGFPNFQGVRGGVCAKISGFSSSSSSSSSSSGLGNVFDKTTRAFKNLFVSDPDLLLTPTQLMAKRSDLFSRMVEMDREYERFLMIFKQLELYSSTIQQNNVLIQSASSHLEEFKGVDENHPASLVYETLIRDLHKANSELSKFQLELTLPPTNPESYRMEKGNLEKEISRLSLLLQHISPVNK